MSSKVMLLLLLLELLQPAPLSAPPSTVAPSPPLVLAWCSLPPAPPLLPLLLESTTQHLSALRLLLPVVQLLLRPSARLAMVELYPRVEHPLVPLRDCPMEAP